MIGNMLHNEFSLARAQARARTGANEEIELVEIWAHGPFQLNVLVTLDDAFSVL